MVGSPVRFSISRNPMPSSNKSTFHPITPILDFTIWFISWEKEKIILLKSQIVATQILLLIQHTRNPNLLT